MPMRPPTFASQTTQRLRAARIKQHSDESNAIYDSTWRRVRRIKLQKSPLCEECATKGKITVAEMVHHVRPVVSHPDLRLVMSNLRSTCNRCHGELHSK